VSIAHVNEVDPGMLDRLAESGAVVLYCPRSNAYFGRPGPEGALHRWREMLSAGVRVALCTDGLPSLDRDDRITPLDDARLLWRRGDARAELLLEMITLEGLAAMGIPADQAVLAPGARHGVLGFEVPEPARGFEAVLACDAAPTWVSQTVGTRIA
jgi:cytosine/adenosine deaminase-related metal-dependent hydrolase